MQIKVIIAIIGYAPEQDVAVLRRSAEKFGAAVAEYRRIEDAAAAAENRPLGYLSFLPAAGLAARELLDIVKKDRTALAPLPLFQLVDGADIPAAAEGLPIAGLFTSPLSEPAAWTMVHALVQGGRTAARTDQLLGELMQYRQQKNRLVEIGTALSRENDLNSLLGVILSVGRAATAAEAGNIYLRERAAGGGPFLNELRCKGAQNDAAAPGKTGEFRVPVDRTTIAGHVALTGRPLNIPDVNAVDPSLPYRGGKEYRIQSDYRVTSMLTLPLKNQEGGVVGVLQLMNKRERPAAAPGSAAPVPFTGADMDFMESVAAQAAVSIERAQLDENVRELFEGFLRSSIAAIDERDRTTSGHSKRVMGYAMAFAEAAAREPGSPFAELVTPPERRRQLQFAALLHDIGKIGVPERILNKESRLEACEFALLMAKLDQVTFALKHAPTTVSWKSTKEVADDRRFLERINAAARLGDDDLRRLALLRDNYYHTPDGRKARFLSDHEWESLSVRVGNLTEEERKVIHSHAYATYRILSKIPWTRQFEMIPVIAATHHERIDGSGYPHGLRGGEMTIESRILAVIDIYEALVAQDRPYKPKMPPEKALEILRREVAAGHLDAEVVRFFIDKEIYKLYTDRKKT
jgi:HD-GYP domain-containing protein (c-di-GMP phosphodiesterase class II)